jgi:hypothetical protein
MQQLLNFITERESIRRKREAGLPFPWTDNPILRDYKFCNISREHDAVTKGVGALYREPHKDDPDLWFALVVARRAVNWPDTLKQVGYPVPWNPDRFKAVVRARQAAGLKAFEGQAYRLMVSGQQGEQVDLLVNHVLNPIWENPLIPAVESIARITLLFPFPGGPWKRYPRRNGSRCRLYQSSRVRNRLKSSLTRQPTESSRTRSSQSIG